MRVLRHAETARRHDGSCRGVKRRRFVRHGHDASKVCVPLYTDSPGSRDGASGCAATDLIVLDADGVPRDDAEVLVHDHAGPRLRVEVQIVVRGGADLERYGLLTFDFDGVVNPVEGIPRSEG